MKIVDQETGARFDVTGSVKKPVAFVDCISFIDADGITQTVEFAEGQAESGQFLLSAE